MKNVDIAIIGGGPAGLAAAIGAKQAGAGNILILEREAHLGGILNQCIHNGFGLHRFNEELTGPEYAARYERQVKELDVPYLLDTMVLEVSPDKKISAVNSGDVLEINAKAVILAMGCRERPRGAINIPGTRPAGVYTAGTVQKFVNLDGYMPGKKVVVLGSGDIGLIMARRMTFEGAKVEAVIEIMPHSSGLKRNIVQCLNDFDIPLKLSHTVTEICGKRRLEGVKIAKVDENRKPIKHTEKYIECDTLLLSVGLIPENELSKNAGVEISPITNGPIVNQNLQTNVDGIFACGNVLHVHDLVDYVSEEGEAAGAAAAAYVLKKNFSVNLNAKPLMDKSIMEETITCISCPLGCLLIVTADGTNIISVVGASCDKGHSFAEMEIKNPVRTVTSTVPVKGSVLKMVSVKTNIPILKGLIFDCLKSLVGVEAKSPVRIGDVIVKNVCGTGVDIVATRNA